MCFWKFLAKITMEVVRHWQAVAESWHDMFGTIWEESQNPQPRFKPRTIEATPRQQYEAEQLLQQLVQSQRIRNDTHGAGTAEQAGQASTRPAGALSPRHRTVAQGGLRGTNAPQR